METSTLSMARRIEVWPVGRLVPYATNPRTHSDGQVAQIAASILKFGFTNPILVDSADGIVAGHGRLLAAQKLGLDEVPVIVLDHLTDALRRAYIIADNKLALNAGWDDEKLASMLRELRDEDFDLDVIGFSDEEIELLLADPDAAAPGQTDEDAVPEPPVVPVTRAGDMWVIGGYAVCPECGEKTNL